MRNRTVVAHKQKIDAAFAKVQLLNSDVELQAHWSRYLCVLVSGFIETSIETLVVQYASKRSPPEIAHYIGNKLKRFTNAKAGKILELVEEFSPEMKHRYSAGINDEIKDAINSVVANRHQIAHGRDVGISFVTIKTYYRSVVRAIEEFENQFDPQ